MDLLGDIFNQASLIDLIGQLRNDDAGAASAELLHLRLCPNGDLPSAGAIGGTDAAASHDDAAGGEIGALDVLHQIVQARFRIFHHADGAVNDLPQVVGRDVGGHADSDTGGAVDQQVRKTGGQDTGFLAALVEVGIPIYRVLFDVPQHFAGDLGQASLGVTVSGRRVAVHAAEVAVAVHQGVPHGEGLRQTHQGIVNRAVAMGMIPTQHVAHAGGGLLEGAVRGQIVLIHSIQDTAMHRFQTVPHIGQGTANDDGHGVVHVRRLHLML